MREAFLGGGEFIQFLYERLVATVAGPHIGVANSHSGEGEYGAAPVLVHYLEGFGRSATRHLADIEQRHVVAQCVVGEQAHVADGDVGAEGAVAEG